MNNSSPVPENSSSKRKKLVWNILNTLFLAMVGSLWVIFGAVKSFWPEIEAFLYVATELPWHWGTVIFTTICLSVVYALFVMVRMTVQGHHQQCFHKILVPLGIIFWGLLLIYLIFEGGG